MCNAEGSEDNTCDENGKCFCNTNVVGDKCDQCNAGFVEFPACDQCAAEHFGENCQGKDFSRGHREGGPIACSKNFKTPFFKRYSKTLLRGYSNGSRTSPFFFFLKYLNKYGC